MESIYKNKKYIAGIIIVPIVFILLFAFNFKKCDGAYNKGNLEESIINQSKECILSNYKEVVKDTFHIKPFMNTCFIDTISNHVLFLFTLFICICRSKLFFERKYTLVSLRVRMDE